MADRYLCTDCSKVVTATANNRYRTHSDGAGDRCVNASEPIPQHLLDAGPETDRKEDGVPKEGVDFATCPRCDRKVKLTRLGYFEPHQTKGERCETSGVRLVNLELPEKVELATEQVKTLDEILSVPSADSSASTETSSPESSNTSNGSTGSDECGAQSVQLPAVDSDITEDAPTESSTASTSTSKESPKLPPDESPFSLGVTFSRFLQPFSPFLQPGEWIPPTLVFLQPPAYETVRAEPMGDLAKELATKIKETFYSYSNRKSTDNRSAQTTLGPSEIGTPCDRRLAMSLMGIPPVNAGGDGWAAFVGTCTHEGMANIYTFADAGTGRYAVELPVFTGSPTVPRGTTDLLDRRDGTVVDWKVMGAYSLKKFKAEGPSATYRTQAHVYGLGAERSGERVKSVAIVGLPRAGSSLDEMHVWTEKYDRRFAQAALDRVERIGARLNGDTRMKLEIAATIDVADDCRYCPFHLKKDAGMQKGCPGA